MVDLTDSQLERLVRDIDKDPDPLHEEITPAVLQLIGLGLAAAKSMLELLDAPDAVTRKRAQRVVEGVVMQRYGWQPGQGYLEPDEGQQNVRNVLEKNGSYDADAPLELRRRSIVKWRKWIEENEFAEGKGVH